MKTRLLIVCAIAIAFGCRKPAKLILTKDQRERIQQNILQSPPTPNIAINANFADNIRLLGADISANKVKAGDTVTVTYYWECVREIQGEWKVFVHVELPKGRRMILDHNPVGELYPISNWKKGEIIKDEQAFAIPQDAEPGQAVIWAGIFNEAIYRERGGGDRMELKNKEQVPNDGDNRVKVVQFTVARKEEPTQGAKVLGLKRASGEIKVDGKLADPARTNASRVELTRGVGQPVSADETTVVMALFDDKNLYIGFHLGDNFIETPYKDRDSELWNADAVEMFLDAQGDGKDYLEIQVSPKNVVFDALFKTRRNPPPDEAKAFNMTGLRTAVYVTGSVNNNEDKDSSYDVEIAVPWAEVAGLTVVPPRQDAIIKANFFRVEAKDGKVQWISAFAPTTEDFHDLSRAGFLKVEEGSAQTTPAVEGGASAREQIVSPALREALPAKKGGSSLKPEFVPAIKKAMEAQEAQKALEGQKK